jgi:hypothetical protein
MNDIITNILNALVAGLLEALKPHIDARIKEKLDAMPDPLNGAYVTGEEFREFEKDLNELKEERAKEGMSEGAVVGLVRKEIETALGDFDVSDQIDDHLRDYDFSDDVEDALGNIDFDDKIREYHYDHNIPSEDEVKDIVDARVDEVVGSKLENAYAKIKREIGQTLVDAADANEGI